MKIAVLSDLHVGTAARSRAREFCPDKYPDKDKILDDTILQKFVNFTEENGITADYLLLPGDVTNKADPEEVVIASNTIETIRAALKVDVSKIFYVPGNHDVDWSVISGSDTTGLRWQQRFDPLKISTANFLNINNAGESDIFAEPFFNIWEDDAIITVGYNSAHADKPNAKHYGKCVESHLDELENNLRLRKLDGKIRIFLIHHHPLQISDPSPEEPDFSILDNAGGLLNRISALKFDFLVHGHKHRPFFQTLSIDGMHPLGILSSGSFSVRLPLKWTESIRNQFHLIDVAGRDSNSGIPHGKVSSWAYGYLKGWEESVESYAGIPHSEFFGSDLLPHKIEDDICEAVLDAHKIRDYVTWTSIIESKPHLSKVRTSTALKILQQLEMKLGVTCHGNELTKIIILNN